MTTKSNMEWQKIETAPKDGTKIFIWKNNWDFAPIVTWSEIEAEEMFYGWVMCDEIRTFPYGVDDYTLGWNEDIESDAMPTHWMPLPEPPKETL